MVVLLDNGDVVAYGWNGSGQCDVPSFQPGRKAVFVSAGGSHTVILLNDRSVIAFGNDTNGQCTVPDALRGQRVGAVAVGGYHTSSLLMFARRFLAALDLGRIAEVSASRISRSS